MPELPDLIMYRRNLSRHVAGKVVEDVRVFNPRFVIAHEQANALVGKTLERITREGKELFFTFSEGQEFSVHFMLFGKSSIVARHETWQPIAPILSLDFDDRRLFISDEGALCKVRFSPKRSTVPDVFDDTFTRDYLSAVFTKNASANVKACLIDQKRMRGIGNAYADEILYAAGVSPKSTCGALPRDVRDVLYDAIRNVLANAVKEIAARNPDILAGEVRDFLVVHTKARRETPSGHTIRVERVAGKKTYYTDEQVLYI